jgi:hypothetical protein
MSFPRWKIISLAIFAALLPVPGMSAEDIVLPPVVEVAPFAGYQFGGAFDSATSGNPFDIGSGFVYGGTVNVLIYPTWRVELLYSRQEAELTRRGEEGFDLKVERYLAGIQEEKGDRVRFFGTFLIGLTRFAPGLDGFDADEVFTVGLALGLKTTPSRRVGLRAEARGFFLPVDSGGGVVCRNGACLFRFQSSGIWQGDVTAGVLVGF